MFNFGRDVRNFLEKHDEYARFMKFGHKDNGLMYAMPCSELDISPECERSFIEFQVEKILLPWDKNTDLRYLVYCSVPIRNHKLVNGLGDRYAYVSVVSPCLFTWNEYGNVRNVNDRGFIGEKLSLMSSLLKGGEVDSVYKNWQREHRTIIKKNKLNDEEVFQAIRMDLSDICTPVKLFDKVELAV